MRHRLAGYRPYVVLCAVAAGCLALANCAQQPGSGKLSKHPPSRLGVSASPRVVEPGQPIPKGGGAYIVGKPYTVAGRVYVPREDRHYRAEGTASWYGDEFHGRLTANGEVYDMDGISAAHPTMPLPSYARVTNLRNGRSLVVRVNDRGPYHEDRVIDLSGKSADLLGFRGKGLSRVRVEYVGPAALEGSDDRQLMATLRENGPAPSSMVASARPFISQSSRMAAASAIPMPVAAERRELDQPTHRQVLLHLPENSAPLLPRRREAAARPASMEARPASMEALVDEALRDPVAEPTMRAVNGRGLY